MADCGGLPQVDQVGLYIIRIYRFAFKSAFFNLDHIFDFIVITSTFTLYVNVLSQPGKLIEAFKYFIQGMGYSKHTLF